VDSTEGKVCLEVQDIAVSFEQVAVLRGISFMLREREIVSIIGPNGAGKSTLFNVICGLTRPCVGRVGYYGKDITRWPSHRICHAGIARTFQVARPFLGMTALENVMVGLTFGKTGGGKWSAGTGEALRLLDLVELSHKADLRAEELTLSELRRLEAARALSTRPKLLLLDEIAAGLSPQVIDQWVRLLKTLRAEGLSLLIIDHFLSLTTRVSDRLIALHEGRQIAEGEPEAVLASSGVVAAYLGETGRRYHE
jgi:ABC-type branched-subunit amino acid transport system ATPase component